jgi:hypothetical protein
LKGAASVGPRQVAVAAANDAQTVAACVEAGKLRIADSILAGR